jgi:predicted nuclease of predicted toxin-antitoxin system
MKRSSLRGEISYRYAAIDNFGSMACGLRGHDAFHAAEIGLNRATDQTIIARARREDRTIITADLDCPRLLAVAHATEPSLILFRGGDWSEEDTIARTSEILEVANETDIQQSILVVDRDRIGRRRLPIRS